MISESLIYDAYELNYPYKLRQRLELEFFPFRLLIDRYILINNASLDIIVL